MLRFDHLRLLDEVSLSPSPDSGAALSRTEMKPLAGFTVEDEGPRLYWEHALESFGRGDTGSPPFTTPAQGSRPAQ